MESKLRALTLYVDSQLRAGLSWKLSGRKWSLARWRKAGGVSLGPEAGLSWVGLGVPVGIWAKCCDKGPSEVSH